VLPDPLHPAAVHFPIVLAVLAPFVSGLVLLAIRAGRLRGAAWRWVVGFHLLLACSAWGSAQLGHREEERVERVVDEDLIEEHEEAGERLVWVVAGGLALSAAGLLTGGAGAAARAATVGAGLIALAGAVWAGHSGGELVYRHGAALAYGERGAATPGAPAQARGGERD
jgi:uncharacterized membrane protein